MTRAAVRLLPGRRLHLQDGPIDLVIAADGRDAQVAAAYAAATARFATVLDELCAELALLRRCVSSIEQPEGVVGQRMWQAVRPYAGICFITPMAAVAGAVADEIRDVVWQVAELERLAVNNGGDIALGLAPGQVLRVGLVDRPDHATIFATTDICAAQKVGGVATSGWRGRSFSLGIADAVTVLATTAASADAAATVIANAVDLEGHPAVGRVPARHLQPDSDLGDRPVTRSVGPLSHDEIRAAMSAGAAAAQREIAAHRIVAAALHLSGTTRIVGALPTQSPWRLTA